MNRSEKGTNQGGLFRADKSLASHRQPLNAVAVGRCCGQFCLFVLRCCPNELRRHGVARRRRCAGWVLQSVREAELFGDSRGSRQRSCQAVPQRGHLPRVEPWEPRPRAVATVEPPTLRLQTSGAHATSRRRATRFSALRSWKRSMLLAEKSGCAGVRPRVSVCAGLVTPRVTAVPDTRTALFTTATRPFRRLLE
jgi:hypothetical protein